MAIYGYARVSSSSQSLAIQQEALEASGCDVIRSEKVTGTKLEGRSELETIIQFARAGDSITVTRIDRLARSVADLAAILARLEAKGVSLRVLEQPVDTSTAAGRCFLQMLSVFAEFETAIRRERQLEGIAKAKVEGVYKGRKATIDAERIKALAAQGMGATAIAKELKVGRASVYRLLQGSDQSPRAEGSGIGRAV
ncbi:recombinase family protein [Methylobacterium oryzae]|uniref:recombinase family protein n=1 Tax=Methylobacterium oryzae TaxID=334852 RepID=UPI001F43FA49|nr:recombinase family protein [Methylobacterium oryzae]UIN34878.1 recombinase family protein [Methylobacterium oryzae]